MANKKAHTNPGPSQALLDTWESTEALADLMVKRADVQRGVDVLVPAAGCGAQLRALERAGILGQVGLTAIEPSGGLALALRGWGVGVVVRTFQDACFRWRSIEDPTLVPVSGYADRILLVPPLSGAQPAEFVLLAVQLLQPAGRLVAVVPRNVTGPKAEGTNSSWRQLLTSHGYPEPSVEEIDLPDLPLPMVLLTVGRST